MSKKNISVGQDGIVIPPTKEDENYNAMLNAKELMSLQRFQHRAGPLLHSLLIIQK